MYFEKSFALHGAFWHSSFAASAAMAAELTPNDPVTLRVGRPALPKDGTA